jgi:hypothetical protein
MNPTTPDYGKTMPPIVAVCIILSFVWVFASTCVISSRLFSVILQRPMLETLFDLPALVKTYGGRHYVFNRLGVHRPSDSLTTTDATEGGGRFP